MIIGVMSDTHGYLTEMRRAASRMMDEFGAGVIVHLGDDSTDADDLRGMVPELISVPGVLETRYSDRDIPNRIILDFENVPFLITHTPKRDPHDLPDDIDPTAVAQDGEVNVVLYGHTHKPSMTERSGVYYINPGHLNPRDNRGSPMSFAIIELSPPKMEIKIVELEGGTLDKRTFFLE